MNDLEWLARNVHEWPEGAAYIAKHESRDCWTSETENGANYAQHNDMYGARATKETWLSERARLQNNPSWDDVPTQYSWYGQNASGKWDCFEYEPFANEHVNCWDYESGDALGLPNVGEVLGDWRDTLERRPESIEPEQPEWKQGELPPVGTVCDVLFGFESYTVWRECKILFIGEKYIVIYMINDEMLGEQSATIDSCTFRPLRTEEDMAIDDIKSIFSDCYANSIRMFPNEQLSDPDAEAYAKAIYAAGYRKQDATE